MMSRKACAEYDEIALYFFLSFHRSIHIYLTSGERNLGSRGALHLNSSSTNFNSSPLVDNGGGGGGGQMMKGSGGGGVGGHSNEQIVDKDSMRMLRVWDVKKCDPTVPVFRYSMNRRLAAIQPR
jgi:hypothetical protein